MCPVCVTLVVWPHIRVAPIYLVIVVATVLLYVDTYVGLLSHILEWSYKMCICGNTTLL